MNIAQYMDKALFDSETGFYENQNITDHFQTPLTWNSGFKNLIASYILSLKQPLLEIGPGHGLLAQTLAEKDFQQNITLCEKSKFFRTCLEEKFKHLRSIDVLADLPVIKPNTTIFLQEVLDCFPAHWYEFSDGEIYEKYLSVSGQLKRSLVQYPEKISYVKYLIEHQYLTDKSQVLYSPQAQIFFEHLLSAPCCTYIIIDYGYLSHDLIAANHLVKCPLRAYKNQQQIEDFWHTPGQCDLTYDIDFSWYLTLAVNRGAAVEFYGTLAEFIMGYGKDFEDLSLLKPYLDPRQLGEAFKVALLKTPELKSSACDAK